MGVVAHSPFSASKIHITAVWTEQRYAVNPAILKTRIENGDGITLACGVKRIGCEFEEETTTYRRQWNRCLMFLAKRREWWRTLIEGGRHDDVTTWRASFLERLYVVR